jgi:DNA-binding response OmpR family regulator
VKILLIEDDAHIVSFLQRGLVEEGHSIDSALDGEEGEYLASINAYDLIILDWMLPSKNGIEILNSLRQRNISTSVLMLTAKGEIDDKVLGLNSGADDYLSKPFSFKELLARIDAIYRRSLSDGKNTILINDLNIDISKKIVKKEDIEILLTAKEYELLLFLIKSNSSNYLSFKKENWKRFD